MPLLKGPQALINFALIIVLPKKNARGRRAAPVWVGELLPGVGRQHERLGGLGAVLEVVQFPAVPNTARFRTSRAPARDAPVPRGGSRERGNETEYHLLLPTGKHDRLPILCHWFLLELLLEIPRSGSL